jgi:hypothetical protein
MYINKRITNGIPIVIGSGIQNTFRFINFQLILEFSLRNNCQKSLRDRFPARTRIHNNIYIPIEQSPLIYLSVLIVLVAPGFFLPLGTARYTAVTAVTAGVR